MFSKLALKNIRRSIKDYAIYFFTLALGVAIFYVFNALDSQAIMLDVNDRVREMLELMNIILGVVSVFVASILGALIIYASRFLIKRRSKEFGIYLTLGMSKRKISLVLLIETFFIGLFSLAIGLIFGILASQLTSIIVANMFDANLTHFQFVFSLSALLKTLAYFGVIYLVVMIFNVIIVSRQKLINLLSSSRRSEQIKLKNPWFCTLVFVVAAIILARAYYLVTDGINFMADVSDLLIPIIMGVIATILIFWSLSGLLLRIFMSLKNIYYHKLNSFVLRQFSSKINTTVISMSLICLMLFVTVCILGSALSINHKLHATIDQSLPVDVSIEAIGESPRNIEAAYASENIDLDDLLKDTVSYHTYSLSDYTMSSSLGDVTATLDENNNVSASHVTERFIHQAAYNQAARLFGLEEVDLANEEYAILANVDNIVALRNQALSQNTQLDLLGRSLKPKFEKCLIGTIDLEMANLNSGLIIVPDNLDLESVAEASRETLLGNYQDPNRSEAIDHELSTLADRFFKNQDEDDDSSYNIYYFNVSTRQEIIDESVGTSALVTFIGLYLGIIFLISSAAVLALKELSESSDNRTKYSMLRKIGASEKSLNHALFWQILIFFVFPLLIAILHSIFGLKFCNLILSNFGGIDIGASLPGVSLFLICIYGGYFLITYFCSKNIIRARRS